MKLLFSCVGDTDPIRFNHDGAILHIVRIKRPDLIFLIHSEGTVDKHDFICNAIFAIDKEYRPQIIKWGKTFKNAEIFIFDLMFNELEKMLLQIRKEYPESDLLLNLSSGTPQVKSALFTLNRIYSMGLDAYQVATPNKGSNLVMNHEPKSHIKPDEIIKQNIDNQLLFDSRLQEDSGINFIQSLLKKSLRELILNYDYHAVLGLLKTQQSFPNQEQLVKELEDIIKSINLQMIPEKLTSQKIDASFLTAYYSCAIMKMKFERGEYAVVTIKSQAIIEFLLIKKIRMCYPGALEEDKKHRYKFNYECDKTLTEAYLKKRSRKHNWDMDFWEYINLLNVMNEEKIVNIAREMGELKSYRNAIAHNLDPIKSDAIYVNVVVDLTIDLLFEVFPKYINFKKDMLKFFKKFNEHLIKYIE